MNRKEQCRRIHTAAFVGGDLTFGRLRLALNKHKYEVIFIIRPWFLSVCHGNDLTLSPSCRIAGQEGNRVAPKQPQLIACTP